MKLPPLDDPARYRRLYVFDFGEWVAVGYTADEIAMLLESERFRDGRVFQIYNAWPDGRMELRGISNARFQLESGMLFFRGDSAAAAADFDELLRTADTAPPPCRAFLHLATLGEGADARHVTVLGYPAEYDDEIGDWLTRIGYAGGDWVEGGSSCITTYQDTQRTVHRRAQLTAREHASRSREEVYSSIRKAVQR
ncbi:MAG: hypothetical protein HRU75_13760 [Planctomycetia bacterium]|nr:MAG: hypothetical protein HRU75_13760 [Planctomycetia bacterium]